MTAQFGSWFHESSGGGQLLPRALRRQNFEYSVTLGRTQPKNRQKRSEGEKVPITVTLGTKISAAHLSASIQHGHGHHPHSQDPHNRSRRMEATQPRAHHVPFGISSQISTQMLSTTSVPNDVAKLQSQRIPAVHTTTWSNSASPPRSAVQASPVGRKFAGTATITSTLSPSASLVLQIRPCFRASVWWVKLERTNDTLCSDHYLTEGVPKSPLAPNDILAAAGGRKPNAGMIHKISINQRVSECRICHAHATFLRPSPGKPALISMRTPDIIHSTCTPSLLVVDTGVHG